MILLPLLLAASASAQPKLGVERVLSETRALGLGVPAFAAIDVPPAAPSAPADSELVPAGLWAALAPPDGAVLAWLGQRVPGLDLSAVRELPPEAAEAIFARGAARGTTPIDLFTDRGFRGREVFYIPRAAVERVFSVYEVRVLTLASGTAKDGQPFQLDALLAGAGRIEALYDRGYTVANPYFADYTYNLEPRVTQAIAGPGDIRVSGITVNAIVRATIKRMVKVSPGEVEVEVDTRFGAQTQRKRISAIRRR